jgi:hypothetical protein
MTAYSRGWGSPQVADYSRYDTGAPVSAFGPSEEYAAGRAAAEASTAFDQAGGAEARRMSSMGINPNSGRFAGLRQKWALRKAAGVSGAATRAAGAAREASFERLLRMISAGRNGAFRPQERAINAGFGGSSTVGRTGQSEEGGDYNSRVQRYLAQLRGEAVPGAEGRPGVIGIGETRPGVIGIGEGAARNTGELRAFKDRFPNAGRPIGIDASGAAMSAEPPLPPRREALAPDPMNLRGAFATRRVPETFESRRMISEPIGLPRNLEEGGDLSAESGRYFGGNQVRDTGDRPVRPSQRDAYDSVWE